MNKQIVKPRVSIQVIVFTCLITIGLLYNPKVFSQAIQIQTFSWAQRTQQQLSMQALQKMSANLRLLPGAPKEFLQMKAQVIEISALDTEEPIVGVLVKSFGYREELESLGAQVGAQIGDIFSVRIPINRLTALANLPSVTKIDPSVLRKINLDQSIRDINADDVHQGNYNTTPPTYSGYTGRDVIIGTLDTGIDWQHEDFINDNDGTSRIAYIWDQTIQPLGAEQTPDGFSYGVEYSRQQINDELDGSPQGFVRTEDDFGHGTHVAGIAAGDGSATGNPVISPAYTYVGVAPRADIIAIRGANVAAFDFGFSLTEELDAIAYLMKKGDELGKPVILNLSLGGHFGPHDGTELESQAIDAAINSGKINIVISAGNEGTDTAHGEYIHAEGTVSSGGRDTTEFVIPSYTANSGSGNDFFIFDMWYQGGDRLTVKVLSPRGYSWNAVSGSSRNNTAANTPDGAIFIDNASAGTDPGNSDRNCGILIFDALSTRKPRTGTWKIIVTGATVTESGHYDNWLAVSQVGSKSVYFDAGSASLDELVAMPGVANQAITVAAHSTKTSWTDYLGRAQTLTSAVLNDLAHFSSPGPTRDDPGFITGRQKPDISAPGFGVIAALSQDGSFQSSTRRNQDLVHLLLSGTSMSAPHVAGAVALLLEKNPKLTPAQIKSLLTSNARSDAFTGATPNFGWGAGKLDILAATNKVIVPNRAVKLFPSDFFSYALAATTAEYRATIKNLGKLADSYDLSATGNAWATTFWNANGTTLITNTGTMQSGAQMQIRIRVAVPTGILADQKDKVTIKVTSKSNSGISESAKVITRTPGNIPWSETFVSTTLNPVKWPVNRGPVEVTTLGRAEPSSPYSLNLNGDTRGFDEIHTQALNLSGMNGVKLEYYYQRTGNGNSTETGEDLWVDYLNSAGQWTNLKRYFGSGSDMTTFTKETIILSTDAHYDFFQLRFRSKGTPGPNDDWFIDDISLTPPPDIAVTPNSFSTTLDFGQTSTHTMTISNVGRSDLTYQISSSVSGSLISSQVASKRVGNSSDDLPSQKIFLMELATKAPATPKNESSNEIMLPPGTNTINEVEPNNSLTNAQIVEGASPITINGNAEVSDVGQIGVTYTNGVVDDFEDLYKFSVVASGLTVDLTGIRSDCDIFLFHVTSTGNIVLDASSNTTGLTNERIADPALAVGTYYIGVSIFDVNPSGPSSSPYLLTLSGSFSSLQSATWLSFSPTSGTLPPTATQNVTVAFNTRNIIPGRSYSANINITSNDPDEANVVLPTQLTVNPEPFFVTINPSSAQGEGPSGRELEYSLRISNFGQNADSYSLSTTGNRWQTVVFDSTGTTTITSTPTISAGSSLKIIVKVTVDVAAARGDIDSVRVHATSVASPTVAATTKITTTSLGRPLRPPLSDSFLTTTLADTLWTITSGTPSINTQGQNEPSPPYSLELKGGSPADEVETTVIDLAGENKVILSYFYQNDNTETGDDLVVSYFDGTAWVELARHDGGGIEPTTYPGNKLILPTGAYRSNFKFRFSSEASISSDEWFVDDVSLVRAPTIAVIPDSFRVNLSPGDSTTRSMTITNTGGSSLNYQITSRVTNAVSQAMYQTFTLTIPHSSNSNTNVDKTNVDDTQSNESKRTSAIHATLLDLSGVNILWDRSHGQSSFSNWSTIINDLTSRNATVTENFAPITETLLSGFDIFWSLDIPSSWTSSEVTSVQNWLNTGGALLLEGDQSVSAFNNLLPPTSALVYSSANGTSGNTTNIFSHETTLGVNTIHIQAPLASLSVASPAGTLIADVLGAVNTAYSQFGTSRVIALADENFFNNNISQADNQLFANQVFDWLAAGTQMTPWLSFQPSSGVVAPGKSKTVEVKFNATGLANDSTFRTTILVNNNDPTNSSISLPATLVTTPVCETPVHFQFTANTGNSYAIVIDKATLDNLDLGSCDEIGVFTLEGLCVGAAVVNDTWPLGVTAWQDDDQTSEVDGYKSGDQMSFRIWDFHSGPNVDYIATPHYTVGNGNFGFGVFSQISLLEASSSALQVIQLRSGWDWISSYIEPTVADLDSVMRDVENLAFMRNCSGKFYIPGVINQIGDYNVLETYELWLSAKDTLIISGREVPVSSPIPTPVGWSCPAYLPRASISAEVALASLLPKLNIVQNDSGRFYIPGIVNDLGNMRPGEGYKLHMSAQDTLIYPSGTVLSKRGNVVPVTARVPAQHFIPARSVGESFSILISSVLSLHPEIEAGDEVGIYSDSGLLVGVGVWQNEQPLPIAAWMDDNRTDAIDGLQTGDKIIFKFWDASENEEISVNPTFVSGDKTIGESPYAVVELQINQVPKSFSLAQNYPNPFNPETRIRFELPRDSQVKITIFNMLGQEVQTLVDKTLERGYHEVSWNGTNSLGLSVASGLYIYRLEANKFVAQKKMLFLK